MAAESFTRGKFWSLAVAALLLVVLALYTVAYIVPAGYWGVVRTLGAIDEESGVKKDAGLYVKLPWPFQTQQLIDRRLRFLEQPGQEVLTRDKFNINAAVVVGWRVTNPIDYLTKLQNEAIAEETIAARINNERENAIKSITLDKLVTTDRSQPANYRGFEEAMLKNLQASLEQAGYGVQVDFLKVKYLRFPQAVTETIQNRMSAERRRAAATYNAQGESEAAQIKTHAEAEAGRRLADAQAAAIAMRGQGIAEAAQYYNVFAENPELAKQLKGFDVLAGAIGKDTTLILSTADIPGLTEAAAAGQGK